MTEEIKNLWSLSAPLRISLIILWIGTIAAVVVCMTYIRKREPAKGIWLSIRSLIICIFVTWCLLS